MNREIAKAILELDYSEQHHARIAALTRKSNEGELTEDERRELTFFVTFGDMLATLKSEARKFLDRGG